MAAVSFRLRPFGRAGPRLHKPLLRLLFSPVERSLTPWTGPKLCLRLLFMRRRLASQGLVQQLFAEDFPDIQAKVFNLAEFCAPSRALRAIKLVSQVFGNTLNVSPHIVYFCGALLFSRHPWPLSGLESQSESNFPP